MVLATVLQRKRKANLSLLVFAAAEFLIDLFANVWSGQGQAKKIPGGKRKYQVLLGLLRAYDKKWHILLIKCNKFNCILFLFLSHFCSHTISQHLMQHLTNDTFRLAIHLDKNPIQTSLVTSLPALQMRILSRKLCV